VEGVLDHHVLGIHHVHAGEGQVWWDIGFLLLGALLVTGGHLLRRSGRSFGPGAAAGRHEGLHG
jgi:uncharacterized membrane protein